MMLVVIGKRKHELSEIINQRCFKIRSSENSAHFQKASERVRFKIKFKLNLTFYVMLGLYRNEFIDLQCKC